MSEKYDVIGLMSGTSLDGLDLCYCELNCTADRWTFDIKVAKTVPYTDTLRERLQGAPAITGIELAMLHSAFGRYCGEEVNRFCDEEKIRPGLIASHGHTVFHRPDQGYTLQIGCGATIAAITGITTACDFRTGDVALGGQGAPLVPIGDRLLFGDYDYCLNIGGFSNISFEQQGRRIAYDLCPSNIVLNELAGREGQAMDKDGRLAAGGQCVPDLLERLNTLPFYQASHPKSLGREWVDASITPLLQQFVSHPTEDLLNTFTEHIAWQIARTLPNDPALRMLVSGGGALNTFLINRIRHYCRLQVVVAEPLVLHYKEALIFALLGVLRLRHQTNCLASVTGASTDHCSGYLYPGRCSSK